MEHRAADDRIVARLNPGENVIDALEQLRDRYDIEGAFFVGIGAVDDVTLGHYDVDEEDYREKRFEGQFEVTNFTGNIGPDKIHAHITLGDRDFEAIGGHCSAATVSGTFELVILRTGTTLDHMEDASTGLDVFALGGEL